MRNRLNLLAGTTFAALLLLHGSLPSQTGTSHRRWRCDLEGTVVQSPAIGSDGTIYIGTGMFYDSPPTDGLYAIGLDGTLKWKRHLGRPVHSSIALDAEENLYFLAGNIAGSDHTDAVVISLDASGTLRWSSEAIGWLYPNPLAGFTPAIASDGTIYACGRFSLFALDANGNTKWKYEFPLIDNTTSSGAKEPAGTQRSAPTIAKDGTIYVNTAIGTYGQTEVKGGLFAINPNGTLKWRTYDVGGYAAPVIGGDGTIYTAIGCYWVPGAANAAEVAKESRLLAIDPNGALKWSVTTELWAQASPSIGSDKTLYVGTTHHPLNIPAWFYAISADGQIKWKYDTYNDVKDMPPAQTNPPDIYNSPVIDSNGRVYFGNEIGLFYAMSPEGNVEWVENIWSLHDQGPALASDGTLVIATHSPFGLLALTTASRGLADSPWPKFRRNNANTGNAASLGSKECNRISTVSDAFYLAGNYPNPFNPETTIAYRLPAPGFTVLCIFDMNGRQVAELANGRQDAGLHHVSWNGTDHDGAKVSSGVYFCRLQAAVGGSVLQSIRKLCLVR